LGTTAERGIHITGVRTKSDAARMEFKFLDGAEWVSGTASVGDASFAIQEDTWLYWLPTGYRSIEEVSEAVVKQVANGVALVAGLSIED
jgi:predicted 2-oxoglutarate/Fe(II)-dependent dioxygenase YbiX